MNEINIEITHDCSLKCIFCSSSANHLSTSEYLKLSTIHSILVDSKKCGATTFSISGGEPLLHPEFFEIIEAANNLEYKILLYTCGIIFDNNGNIMSICKEIWQRIRKISNGNIVIIFSLHGISSRVVDILTGIKGALSIHLQSIRNIKECHLRYEAHVVPMTPNYSELISVADMAENEGFSELSFLRFVPQGRGYENIQQLLLSPQKFLELQYMLLRLLKENENGQRKCSIRIGHPIDFTFLIDPERKIRACRAGKDAPCILPDGNVYMCPACKNLKSLKAGNIHEKSINEIWYNSDYFNQIRELIMHPTNIEGKCKGCIYINHCVGACVAQRILITGIEDEFPKCLYMGFDPLCPLVNKMARGV